MAGFGVPTFDMAGGEQVPVETAEQQQQQAFQPAPVGPVVTLVVVTPSAPMQWHGDRRMVNKPRTLGDDAGDWSEFRFELLNYMCMIHPQYTEDMRLAGQETTAVNDLGNDGLDLELKRRSDICFMPFSRASQKAELDRLLDSSKTHAMDMKCGDC